MQRRGEAELEVGEEFHGRALKADPGADPGTEERDGKAERFAELGTTPVSEDLATPEAHRERLQSQTELWKPIFEKAGVQPQ